MVAAKIQSCYTILCEMDAGAPTPPFAGGGDHSETTETRPDGETRTLSDIASGFEIYGYKGEKLRGFVPTLPGLQFFEHSNLLRGILAVNLDLPLCVFLLDASETRSCSTASRWTTRRPTSCRPRGCCLRLAGWRARAAPALAT